MIPWGLSSLVGPHALPVRSVLPSCLWHPTDMHPVFCFSTPSPPSVTGLYMFKRQQVSMTEQTGTSQISQLVRINWARACWHLFGWNSGFCMLSRDYNVGSPPPETDHHSVWLDPEKQKIGFFFFPHFLMPLS